jgi:hypothetical protein
VLFDEADGRTKITAFSKTDSENELQKLLEMGITEGFIKIRALLKEHLENIPKLYSRPGSFTNSVRPVKKMALNKAESDITEHEIFITCKFSARTNGFLTLTPSPKNWPVVVPSGFTITTHQMDFKPGGTWSFIMQGPTEPILTTILNTEQLISRNKLYMITAKSPEILFTFPLQLHSYLPETGPVSHTG